MTGYEVVMNSTEASADDYKELTVSCPPGKILLSGGAGIYYDSLEVLENGPRLVSSFIYPNDTSWYAEAIQPAELETEWWMEVQAICAFGSP